MRVDVSNVCPHRGQKMGNAWTPVDMLSANNLLVYHVVGSHVICGKTMAPEFEHSQSRNVFAASF